MVVSNVPDNFGWTPSKYHPATQKLVCIKNCDIDGNKSVPWTREDVYHKLVVGKTYNGEQTTDRFGIKWCWIEEFDHQFATQNWFIPLEEYRQGQIDKILIP